VSPQYCTVTERPFPLVSVSNVHLQGHPAGGSWDRQSSDHTISLYERALVRDPSNHLLLFDLAGAYALRGRISDSEQILIRVLNLYPRSAIVRSKAGKLYRRINRPMQAIHHFRRALELNPQHPDSAAIRADLSMHDPQTAI
jgi:tetratricopeptide (TPR) repeat protein